jgi:hypothetical protein
MITFQEKASFMNRFVLVCYEPGELGRIFPKQETGGAPFWALAQGQSEG